MTTPPAQAPGANGPPHNCPLCPRLAEFRAANRAENPAWFNGAVPSFGSLDARLLVVGMAPGLRGANRTGRPFTGDYAGILLYETLLKFGFAQGSYGADPADRLQLVDCRITNAVRCVPPANLPRPAEAATCRSFLAAEIAAMPNVRVLLSLGTLSHEAVLRTLCLRPAAYKFSHGSQHALPEDRMLADSYHVSRYNTSTRRLTAAMFESVVGSIRKQIDET